MSIQSNIYSKVWAPLKEEYQKNISLRHDQLHECYLVIAHAEKNNVSMVDTAAKEFFKCYEAFKKDFSDHAHFPAVEYHIELWNTRTIEVQKKALAIINNSIN